MIVNVIGGFSLFCCVMIIIWLFTEENKTSFEEDWAVLHLTLFLIAAAICFK